MFERSQTLPRTGYYSMQWSVTSSISSRQFYGPNRHHRTYKSRYQQTKNQKRRLATMSVRASLFSPLNQAAQLCSDRTSAFGRAAAFLRGYLWASFVAIRLQLMPVSYLTQICYSPRNFNRNFSNTTPNAISIAYIYFIINKQFKIINLTLEIEEVLNLYFK